MKSIFDYGVIKNNDELRKELILRKQTIRDRRSALDLQEKAIDVLIEKLGAQKGIEDIKLCGENGCKSRRTLDAEVTAMRKVLNGVADWNSGIDVTSKFDEPGAAKAARAVLNQIGYTEGEVK